MWAAEQARAGNPAGAIQPLKQTKGEYDAFSGSVGHMFTVFAMSSKFSRERSLTRRLC
jgi:hypothetical protein